MFSVFLRSSGTVKPLHGGVFIDPANPGLIIANRPKLKIITNGRFRARPVTRMFAPDHAPGMAEVEWGGMQ
jgi:hypothetical protein